MFDGGGIIPRLRKYEIFLYHGIHNIFHIFVENTDWEEVVLAIQEKHRMSLCNVSASSDAHLLTVDMPINGNYNTKLIFKHNKMIQSSEEYLIFVKNDTLHKKSC